jgi:glutathione S-transferase
MALTLHYHPLSSYCWKVLIALYETGAPFQAEIVNLGDPAARAAYAELWPTSKIPLLMDGDRAVPETSIQIEYLDRHCPGPVPLLPADPDARLEARLWDRVFDSYVMTPMGAIVADRLRPRDERDPLAVEGSEKTLAMAYAMIERHMAGRTWAAGEAFSIADCAAMPSLFYASTLVPIPEDHVNLAAYRERLIERPSAARVLSEAMPWFPYYPFKERLPEHFRPAV